MRHHARTNQTSKHAATGLRSGCSVALGKCESISSIYVLALLWVRHVPSPHRAPPEWHGSSGKLFQWRWGFLWESTIWSEDHLFILWVKRSWTSDVRSQDDLPRSTSLSCKPRCPGMGRKKNIKYQESEGPRVPSITRRAKQPRGPNKMLVFITILAFN